MICSEVRAPSSTSPPTPPCRISNPLKEYRTPLSTLQCHRGNTTTIHLYRRGIRPVANKQPIHLTLEGYKPTPTPPHQEGVNHNLHLYQRGSKPITRSNATKEGYNKNKGVYNLVVSFNYKQSLFHKQNDPNRIG